MGYATPTAVPSSYPVAENGTLTVAATSGVLAGAVDTNDLPLSAALVSGPAHGALTLNADGSFTYKPAAGYLGPDSFTYQATDGQATSVVTTVTLTVTVPPVANDDSYDVAENVPLSVTAAQGVLVNDTSASGLPLTATLADAPADGSVVLKSDGAFTYSPNQGYTGPDSFTYVASNGANMSTATVHLTVADVAPVVVAQSYLASENGTLTLPAGSLLVGATDEAGNPLTVPVVGAPANGTITVNPDGSFTYVPNAGYLGPDSFTYEANDGTLNSNVATVNIAVGQYLQPTALPSNYSVSENGILAVPAMGVLSGAADPNGLALSAVLVSGPSHGSLTLGADGSFVYSPAANYAGADSFSYQATDGPANSAIQVVSIQVAATLITNSDAYAVTEDLPLSVDAAQGVLANDTDTVGLPITASLLGSPTHGTLTFNPDGSFLYTPAAGFTGQDSFTYKATDGVATSGAVTVTLNVADIAPVPLPQSYQAPENGTLAVGARAC